MLMNNEKRQIENLIDDNDIRGLGRIKNLRDLNSRPSILYETLIMAQLITRLLIRVISLYICVI